MGLVCKPNAMPLTLHAVSSRDALGATRVTRLESQRFKANRTAASSGDEFGQTRQRLRKELRAKRRALSHFEQASHAREVCRLLFNSALVLRGRVGAYAAVDGELDLWSFIARHPRIALPVVESPTRMRFSTYRLGDPMQINRFGIPEPAGGRRVPALALSSVLAPLVAFSDDGNRLGVGAGYYDRHFSHTPRPLLIGVAHELQHVRALKQRAWDVPLDAVVTERGWRYFSKQGAMLALRKR